jgi:ABC-type transporter Mla subunit MlaD
LCFQAFQKEVFEPVMRDVDQTRQLGNDLIQSAGFGVNTSDTESDLDRMNSKWADLNRRVGERDAKLDSALLQSGKFKDALESMLEWVGVTEGMIAQQKEPSTDSQVIKSQMQEQRVNWVLS